MKVEIAKSESSPGLGGLEPAWHHNFITWLQAQVLSLTTCASAGSMKARIHTTVFQASVSDTPRGVIAKHRLKSLDLTLRAVRTSC